MQRETLFYTTEEKHLGLILNSEYDLTLAISTFSSFKNSITWPKISKLDFIKPNMEYLLLDSFSLLIMNPNLESKYKRTLNLNFAFLATKSLLGNPKILASKL